MNRETLIYELLEEYWSDECDAVGSTNVQNIIEGDVQYKPALGASYIDLAEILTALAAAATFVRHVIDIYYKICEERQKKPKSADLKSEMKNRNLEPDEIDEQTRNKVYEGVCKKLEKETLEED
jgi:hypothetical protein